MTLTTTSTSLFHDQTRTDLNRLSTEIASLQAQIAEGTKDPRPSADLASAAQLSASKERDNALDRFGENARHVAFRLNQADHALSEATDLMQRVREISLQALSDTVPPDARRTVAAEVRVLRDALLDAGNTRDDQGRVLFGGFSTETEPFADLGGSVQYQGDDGVPRLAVSESRSLQAGVTGRDAFGLGQQTGVFETVDDVITLLESGGVTQSGLTRASVLDGLESATNTLIEHRTQVGALSASAGRQSDMITAQKTDMAISISQLEDLDLADAITRLQEALLNRDAAQQTYAQITQRSLFDYMR